MFWLPLLPALAIADAPQNQAQWEEAAQFDCIGPPTHYATPDVTEKDGFRFEYTGATVKLRRSAPKPQKQVRFGLLAGIKDLDPDTQATLQRFFAEFERADVDAVVIGGDTSSEPDQLEAIFTFLANATKRPLLVIAGNMERGASLNYALTKVRSGGASHLVNMDLVRRADFDGADVISLGGYHDKAFLHLAGGCIYTDKHVDQLEAMAKQADDPVVLLTHGPPRQKGQQALDFVPGAENVGDPRLTKLVTSLAIPFGITGHILEAAGKGTDVAGRILPPKKLHPTLFVNQGSANPLPWKLNDGSTSYGLAALMTIEGKKASYEVLRAPKPQKP